MRTRAIPCGDFRQVKELTDLRNTAYKMVGKELAATGGRTYRRYELRDGRKEKK